MICTATILLHSLGVDVFQASRTMTKIGNAILNQLLAACQEGRRHHEYTPKESLSYMTAPLLRETGLS